MHIPCPYCGPRAREEFTVLGGADPRRPDPDAPFESWHAYVHLRDNVAGPTEEYWQHSQGCRQWLVVSRDTRTHEVFGAKACRP